MGVVLRRVFRVALAPLIVGVTAGLAAAQVAGPIGGSVNQATIATRWPAMAYDTQNHVYLAVFGSLGVIKGAFVGDDGIRIGNVFDITTGNYAQTPRVAFNTQDGNFLVVWHSSDIPAGTVVRARAISYPSVTPGTGTVVSSTSFSTVWENGPAVAYGAGSNRYIIAWSYYGAGGWDVAARIVDAAGAPVLAEIPLSSGVVTDIEQEPAAGYFPDENRFIVAWGAYDDVGLFARGRTQLFNAASGTAATTILQFAQGTQVRVADMAWNNSAGQMFLTWIQPDPASGGAFRPYGYYINSSGVFGSATGTKLSSTVGAYDANSVAYNQRTTTFFYVTHGSTEQDFGFEISSAGTPLDTARSVTTVSGTPTMTGSFNPRVAASTQEPRWLIGTAGSFTSLWTQLIGGTAVLPPPGGGTLTYRLTISPTPTGGTVTADGLQCGTGGTSCSVTLQSAATLTLTAAPDANYSFSSWGGSCTGTSATTNVSVDGIKTCSATFTYTGGGGGPGPSGCSAIPTPVFAASPGPVGASVNRGTLATRWPAIAYDECRQLYLAVFGSAGTIMGQFVDDAGTAVGGLFAISSGNYAQAPRVAYNSSAGNFLVVWHSTESATRAGVRGIVVTYPGGTPGPGTVISSASYSTVWENGPAVAYGSGSDRYVIAWAYYSTGSWEVAARMVDGTGTPVLSEMALSSGTANTEQEPSVGYFPDTNRFMVAWGAYDEAGGFARGRTQLFDAASGNAATTQIQFAQGTQIRVSDMALNSSSSQMFLTWIQPDPASGGAFRPFGYYMSSSGVFGSASGARLSSTVGAYDANALAYNPLTATFFLVTHGPSEQDWGFEIASDGTAKGSAAAVTTVSGTPTMTGSFNPRLAASTRQPRWLIGTAGSFTSIWTQLVGGSQPPFTSYSLTISPAPTGGVVTGGGITCGTVGTTCSQVFGSPTTVTLTAVPDAGFALASWGGSCSGSATTASVLVNGDKTCLATFSPLTVTPSSLRFGATKDGAAGKITSVTAAQPVTVQMLGGPIAWTVTADQPWIQITNAAGTGNGQFIVDIINPNNVLGASTNVTAVLTVTPATAGLGATTILVTLTIDLTGTATTPPFGQVDTPLQNATGLVGAVGVTGWALDDVGVRGVKIYRNCLPFDTPASCSTVATSRVVFIGDAAFLDGARPDVEAAFPTYPQPYRAGWGYLLLTNMLPHVPRAQAYGGQGTLTLYAFAFDAEGKTTLLGRSRLDSIPTTITVANDSIAKPFGAIDTPAQGETVSGALANFGWVLTPDADATPGADDIIVPTNGSTVQLFIDGVAVGPIAYNQCRGTVGNPVTAGLYCNDDVANVFGNLAPQPPLTLRLANPTRYRNLDVGNAAIGAYSINTLALTNGLHTIAWGVTDSAGRTEGIGSRNFTVFNAGAVTEADLSSAASTTPRGATDRFGSAPATDQRAALQVAPALPRGDARIIDAMQVAEGTVWGRSGFDLSAPTDEVPASDAGVRIVQLPELGRLELWLGRIDAGYLLANGTLRDLPPGSQLDAASGRFTWMPGPGYVGTYRMVFIRGAGQIPVDVTVRPTRAAGPGEPEIQMYLDTPFTGQVVGQAFTVAGWALDPQAAVGTGIPEVHVWARRRDMPAAPALFVGAATLGGTRPDVAAAYGRQFGKAGFGLTAALEPGYYEITVYVFNRRTDRWEDARTARVTVR